MTFENPTPLRVGAKGTLNHWPARVAGRVVLSTEDRGTRYVWHEFNLVDDAGASATLVFEETEDGPTWKLFREFTPSRPLSAESAAVLRVGATLHLDPAPARVSFVGESRVEHIEGEPPPETHVGDRARFFNAESGDRMLVACWSGPEISYYEGFTAPSGRVAEAFGLVRLPPPATRKFLPLNPAGGPPTSRRALVIAASVLAIAAVIVTVVVRSRTPRAAEVATFVPAPAARLTIGLEGVLAGEQWRIASAQEIEIARVTGSYGCREYRLLDPKGATALLVHGFDADANAWHLLQPIARPSTLTPAVAGRMKRNATLLIANVTHQVVDVFQVRRVNAASATSSRASSPPPGDAASSAGSSAEPGLEYGFVAKQGASWILARWTESELRLFRVNAVTEADVRAAFQRPPPRP